jgi:hypothetical protein
MIGTQPNRKAPQFVDSARLGLMRSPLGSMVHARLLLAPPCVETAYDK